MNARLHDVLAPSVIALLLGCDEQSTPSRRPVEPGPGTVEIALQQGPTVAFEVGIDAVYCAATVRCHPELLIDPFTGQRSSTLVLAYTCNADTADDGQVLDAFQVIQRRMTCYDEGVPSDPTTWTPVEGRVVVPLREEIFAGLVNVWGDTQYHLAVLPHDVIGHAFCRLEAWGVFDAESHAEVRSVRHDAGAAVVRWDIFLSGTSPREIDCHLDEGDASGLGIGNAIHVTHTQPTPITPGSYPRTQSFALTTGSRQRLSIAGIETQVRGLQVAYGLDASFPPAVSSQAGALHTRDIWFLDRQGIEPIDVAGARSCAILDDAGALEAIAVEIVDWWTRVPLGAMVLRTESDAGPFACEQVPGSSACRLIEPPAYAIEAPCLLR